MNDNLAIDGKLYGFIGDASLSLYKDLSVIYFNKRSSQITTSRILTSTSMTTTGTSTPSAGC
ncbi:MAG: hypothetical protein ACLR5G_14285 [Eubacteriales bacterium]